MIELRNITVRIGTKTILSDVSFVCPPQSFTAVIGPNGAGKTSVVRVLLRLLEYQKGSVLFDDRPLTSFSARHFSRMISYVPQDIPASEYMTVERFVSLSRFPWIERWAPLSRQDYDIVEHALEVTGVADLKTRTLATLSGGERQMSAIAAAFAQTTPYIVMDEPASNLDPKHTYRLYRTIDRMIKDEGKSVIVVTHDVNTALSFCNSLVLLKHGSVLRQCSPEAVTDGTVLQILFDIPFGVATDSAGRSVVFPESGV